jgi:CelD/BcsL family acetyltransferase involved in cellulose biosynthesis
VYAPLFGGSLRLQPDRWQHRTVLRSATHVSVEAVAEEWRRLADDARAAPFLRPGWFAAWWTAFGAGRPEIVVLRRPDGPMAACFPCAGGWAGSCPAPTGTARSMACSRADPEAAAALAATLFERRPFELSLGFVDGAAPELDLYRSAAEAAGYRVLERTMQRSPYVVTTGSWETFVRERLSRNRRSQLGRARRRLEREGRVELELADECYRLAFTSDVHERMRFQAFASSAPGLLCWGAFSYGRRAARRALGMARRVGGKSLNRWNFLSRTRAQDGAFPKAKI